MRDIVGIAAVVGTAAAMPVVSACSFAWDGNAVDTRKKAETIGLVINRPYDAHTAEDFARLAVALSGTGLEVKALEAKGDKGEGGAVIVISLTVPGPGPSGLDGEPETVTQCYRYTIRNSMHDHEPQRVDCPDRDPLVLPAPTPIPQLPRGTDQRLRTALRKVPSQDRQDPGAVRAVVTRAVRGPGVSHDVVTFDGRVGVTVSANPYDCVIARFAGDRVEVWRPPRVSLQPGELGCSATVAATGGAQRPPH